MCIRDRYNSDDGYDLYAAHGAVTFKNCQANYNGDCYGIKGDGNGFKLGGVDNKTPGVAAHLDPVNHSLTGCKAIGNKASGFDRNNQSGVVNMKSCTAEKNRKNNYNWDVYKRQEWKREGALGLFLKDNGVQAVYGPKADVLKSKIQDVLGM